VGVSARASVPCFCQVCLIEGRDINKIKTVCDRVDNIGSRES